MSEQLLKAIIQLFAIVAKEGGVTASERVTIREFLARQLNQERINFYLDLFDKYVEERQSAQIKIENTDDETVDFVEDWGRIIQITKKLNQEITKQQKLVLILKMIELILADGEMTERESNLVYYISESLKVRQKTVLLIEEFVTFREVRQEVSKNLLVIDDGSNELSPESKHLLALGLKGLIVIVRLPSVESYFIKYLGSGNVYLNGVSLKYDKGAVFSTGSSIRSYRMEPIYYSDVVSKFMATRSQDRITFFADDISYNFSDGTAGLRNITLKEEAGKLLGIMGSSGSGKSTLLNVLNSNETPSSGRVLINGIDIHRQNKEIEGIIGYIPQDDFLMEDLTVYQNLYYAAKLCFGSYSHEQIDQLVVKTLTNLGLTETRNLKVGNPLEKTISGGQRKRLNVGLELLREPAVLFVDEPTSGLSSRDSENIMDLLKELSLKGKLIFVVIHQPSSDIFKMFDRLIILDVGGYQIYYGNPIEAESYFKDIVNLIDRDLGTCPVCGNIRPEEIFNIVETKVVNEYGRLTEQRKVSPIDWKEHYDYRMAAPTVEQAKTKPLVTLSIPRRLKQSAIFGTRDILSKIGNRQYLLINLLEAPFLAFILAFLVRYQHLENDQYVYSFGKNINIPAFFFMSVIVAIFMGLTVSAEEIIKDRKILKRESFLHLSRGSYLISKVSILFAISAIQTLLFVAVGCLILQIKGMFWAYWIILFTSSCLANVLGLNISSAFKSAITVYILIPILLIPQLILGGVVVKFDDLNPTMSTTDKVPLVGEIMTSRWAYEALMVHQFTKNKYNRLFYDFDKRMARSQYKTLYFIPELETALQRCLDQGRPIDERRNALTLIKNSLQPELELVGRNRLPELNQLTIDSFNRDQYDTVSGFLKNLKILYKNRNNKAYDEKQEARQKATKVQAASNALNLLYNQFQNPTIGDLVTNEGSVNRIVKHKNRLIQKISPIYMQPEPKHFFDFRTQFFMPQKHFAGFNIDTLFFNVMVIWAMILILFLVLYFDLLGKLFLKNS
ncbi:MAG: ATP-binding cassette domain-containing protein [Cyclobacteriaceae bacterium]